MSLFHLLNNDQISKFLNPSFNSLNIDNDAEVKGNLTVDNLIVNGFETITNLSADTLKINNLESLINNNYIQVKDSLAIKEDKNIKFTSQNENLFTYLQHKSDLVNDGISGIEIILEDPTLIPDFTTAFILGYYPNNIYTPTGVKPTFAVVQLQSGGSFTFCDICNAQTKFLVNGTQVVTNQQIGFPNNISGTPSTSNSYNVDTLTATDPNIQALAQRVLALENALKVHGLIAP